MKKILVVDDEEKIRSLLKLYLEKEGYKVYEASDGEEALKCFADNKVDLIVLDLMLPGIDGMEVAKQIRKTSMVPIIMLTARGDEIDKILGLELGADDYIVKPFSPREVLARIKAVLRRTVTAQDLEQNNSLIFGVLEINPEAREIKVNGEEISVTPLEFDLLLYLVNNRGKLYLENNFLPTSGGMITLVRRER